MKKTQGENENDFDDLYSDYRSYCTKNGLTEYQPSTVKFGTNLANSVIGLKKARKRDGSRPNGYIFQPLQKSRELFEYAIGNFKIEWE